MSEFKFEHCSICRQMKACKDGHCSKCQKLCDNPNDIFVDLFKNNFGRKKQ